MGLEETNQNDLDKLSKVYELVPSLIVLTDKHGNITYANPKFVETTGYTLEEVKGKNPRVLKGGGTSQETYKNLWDTINSKKTWFGEFHNKKKNGDFYWAKVSITPLVGKDGEITNFLGIQEDITSIRQQAIELGEKENKYKTLYDSSRDAIMILHPKNGFISGNKSTIILFGFSGEESFINHTPGMISPQFQPDGQLSSVKSEKMIQLALRDGSNFFEWTHKKVNGAEFPATVLLTKVILGGQEVLQATVRDISEQKKLESGLLKSLDESKLFSKMAIDRELRMIELKKEVNELLSKQNKETKYRV